MHSAECWKRLGAQFDARKLIDEAVRVLETDPEGAIPLRHLRAALARLHPITAEPAGVAEYEARRDGTYVEPEPPVPELVVRNPRPGAPRAPSGPDPVLAALAELGARLGALEQRVAPAAPAAPAAAPADPTARAAPAAAPADPTARAAPAAAPAPEHAPPRKSKPSE